MEILLKSGETLHEVNENIRLIQKDGGLKFGTDSYLLSAFIKKTSRGRAADLGAGTGIISLFAAARCKFSEIHAIELQKDFSELVTRNAAANGFDGKIVSSNIDVRDIRSVYSGESFEAVFSNPPYMKSGSGKTSLTDEMNIARREENGTIEDFCDAAAYLLKYGGIFTVVYRPERSAELIFGMMKNGLEPKRLVTVHPDAKSAPCLILVEAKKGASPGVKMSRPLIIYREDVREYTEDMNGVYDNFSLEHLFTKK